MTRLIAIDSDGTLKQSDGTISNRAKNIVKKLISNDIIVVCTARPRYHTLKVSSELGSDNYLISSNGTEVYDNKNKEIIWASYLNSVECKKIFKYAVKNNIRVMFVLEDTEYVTQFTRNSNQILLDELNFNMVLEGNVKQVMVIGSDKEKLKNSKKL